MTKKDVTSKLKQTKATIAKLPSLDRQKWQLKLDSLQRRASGKVSGTSRPGTGPAVPTVHHVVTLKPAVSAAPKLQAAPKAQPIEWDLALANELDKIYQAVSQRATEVRKNIVHAVAEDTSTVGWGIWPLAIAAVAIAWAIGRARE